MKILTTILLWTALVLSLVAGQAFGADRFTWEANGKRVAADIQDWPLPKLLEQISERAGWEVYVEPGTRHEVSVKFKELGMEEALKRLLGNLSYALVPHTNGAPRFYVFRTTVGQATELVGKKTSTDSKEEQKPSEPSKHLIRNEIIVTLTPDAPLTIEEIAKMLDAQIVGRADALRTYRLRFKSEADAIAAREQLRGNENIASIDSNYRFDPPPPGTSAVLGSSRPPMLKPTAKGDPNNLIVGLIDSGVQGLGEGYNDFLLESIALAEGKIPADQLSHGTSMALSLLYGLALAENDTGQSRVKILPVDVYGARQNTTTFDVAYGIYLAINKGAMVINLSLGSTGNSDFLRSVIQDASSQGVIFFAAAGNEPVTTPTYPAAYPEVVAVTAGDRNGNLAPYANRGSFIDIVAPGSTLVQYNQSSYIVGGTSVASAYAAGMASGAVDVSGKSLAEIVALLQKNFPFKPQ